MDIVFGADYKEPFTCSVNRNWLENRTDICASISGSIDGEMLDRFNVYLKRLFGVCGDNVHKPTPDTWLITPNKRYFDRFVAWDSRPKPKKVIINDPATVVFFNDDTKAVTKAKDGDEYDPLFGIMACAMRKVGKNRVRIDAWEPVIDFLSSYLADAKECRVIADMLNTTADALELDGVMDAMEEFDVRNAKELILEWTTAEEFAMKDFSDDKPQERDASDVVNDITSALSDGYWEKVRERTRQTIRDLVDRGEL